MKAQFTLEFSFSQPPHYAERESLARTMASTIARLLSVTMNTYIIFRLLGKEPTTSFETLVCERTRREKTVSVIN